MGRTMNTPQNPIVAMGTFYSTTSMYQFFGYQRRLNLVSLATKHIHEIYSCRLDMSYSIQLANGELAGSCEVIKGHRYISY